jgi:zinc D-Ala-D-Ala carboxypeptidase
MSDLTTHFAQAEFEHSDTAIRMGIDNRVPESLHGNLVTLAELMEDIRKVLGHPITITSGYRGPELNKAVGGVGLSQHQTAQACDFVCPGFGPPDAIVRRLVPLMGELGIDQLIREYGQWVHVSTSATPRQQALIIDNAGTRAFA